MVNQLIVLVISASTLFIGSHGKSTSDDAPLVVESPLKYQKSDVSVTGWTVPLNMGGTDVSLQLDTGSSDFVVVSTLCTSEFCEQFEQYDPEGASDLGISNDIRYGSGAEQWQYDLYEDWVVVGESSANLTSVVFGAVYNLTQATVSGSGILGVGPAYNGGESTIQEVMPDALTFVQTMLSDGKINVPAYTIHFGEPMGLDNIEVLDANNDATDGSVAWGAFALEEGMVEVDTVCDDYMTPLMAFDLCYQADDDFCGRKVSIPIPTQANKTSELMSDECLVATPLIDSGTSGMILPSAMYDAVILELADTYGALYGLDSKEISTMLDNASNNRDSNFINNDLIDALSSDKSVTFDDIVAASPMLILTFENEAKLAASAGDLAQFGIVDADGETFIIGDTVLFGDSVSFHTTEKKMAFKSSQIERRR